MIAPSGPIEIAISGAQSDSSASSAACISVSTSARVFGITAILHTSAPSRSMSVSRRTISVRSGVFAKSWFDPTSDTPASCAHAAIRANAASPTLSSQSSASGRASPIAIRPHSSAS